MVGERLLTMGERPFVKVKYSRLLLAKAVAPATQLVTEKAQRPEYSMSIDVEGDRTCGPPNQ
ncbi:hypothetical protein CRM95_32900 [Burkholderia gladioli]|nr:hypothetical protein CRM95_32900 [Burkholderia gladioli]